MWPTCTGLPRRAARRRFRVARAEGAGRPWPWPPCRRLRRARRAGRRAARPARPARPAATLQPRTARTQPWRQQPVPVALQPRPPPCPSPALLGREAAGCCCCRCCCHRASQCTRGHAARGRGHNPCSTCATACRFVAGRVHRRVRTVCCTPYCGGGTCGTRSREVGPAAECWPRFSLPPTWRSALARPCTRTKFAGERATNEYVHSCRQRNHSFVAKHAPAWRSQSACYERALCQASRGLWHEVRWATPTARTRSSNV